MGLVFYYAARMLAIMLSGAALAYLINEERQSPERSIVVVARIGAAVFVLTWALMW